MSKKIDWKRLKAFHYWKEPSDSEVLEHEIRSIESKIRHWDREDVNELRDYIRDLRSKIEEYNSLDPVNKLDENWLIRLNQILGVHEPLMDFPRGYPVWACDRNGRCLTGENYNRVEKITTIMNKADREVSSLSEDDIEKSKFRKEISPEDLGHKSIKSSLSSLEKKIASIRKKLSSIEDRFILSTSLKNGDFWVVDHTVPDLGLVREAYPVEDFDPKDIEAFNLEYGMVKDKDYTISKKSGWGAKVDTVGSLSDWEFFDDKEDAILFIKVAEESCGCEF